MRKFILIILLCVISPMVSAEMPSPKGEIKQYTKTLSEIFKDIDKYYVDTVSAKNLLRAATTAMFESLDPFSMYISPEEQALYDQSTSDKYAGMGTRTRFRGDAIEILEAYKGDPADLAGLRAGDQLLYIDGQPLETSTASEQLAGAAGTSFTLVYRPIKDTLRLDTVTITRKEITISPIPYYGTVGDSIGYIKFNHFSDDCASVFKAAFQDLQQNSAIRSLIIDLRDNGGGIVEESLEMLSMFLPQNTKVLNIQMKYYNINQAHRTKSQPLDLDIPIAILINSGTASASEILSGALQDLDRAVIIGERSYGKGIVQSVLGGKFDGNIKITTGKYYTPSGRCIQALDYAHRAEDGSIEHIPDSLIKTFTTSNGRKVYSGGGILPDIRVESDTLSHFTDRLLNEYLYIADFANQWTAHNTVSKENFAITDEIYAEFINFMQDKRVGYQSFNSAKFQELRTAAKQDGIDDWVVAQIDQMEQNVNASKNLQLENNREEISSLLKYAILKRLFYNEYAIEESLSSDAMVTTAMEVLLDKNEYQRILTEQDTQKN
ncbi:MAG: S41 family peptidase [Rikenellaceae bacterium]